MATVAHITSDAEISLTECGLFLVGEADPRSDAPHPIAMMGDKGEVSVWGHVETTGYTTCTDCWSVYFGCGLDEDAEEQDQDDPDADTRDYTKEN